MASTTLIASNIQTRLYFIKYIHGKPVGAIDPIDVARLLSTRSVRESLSRLHGITVQLPDLDKEYKEFVEKQIDVDEEGSDRAWHEIEDEPAIKPTSFNARIMVLILFGVLLFAVFASIALFKAKPRYE